MSAPEIPADVWVPEEPHLMWRETRADGQAKRLHCLTCGPLYARETSSPTIASALSADRVRHLSHVAIAAAQAARETAEVDA